MTQPQRFVLRAGDTVRVNVLANCIAFLPRLPADKDWLIEVSPFTKDRTPKQNRTIYGLAEKTLGEFMGLRGADELKELHRELCCLYFGRVDLPVGHRPRRTTTKNEAGERDPIDTKTAADFFEFIRYTAANIGCDIPDPEPNRGRWADEQADKEAA